MYKPPNKLTLSFKKDNAGALEAFKLSNRLKINVRSNHLDFMDDENISDDEKSNLVVHTNVQNQDNQFTISISSNKDLYLAAVKKRIINLCAEKGFNQITPTKSFSKGGDLN